MYITGAARMMRAANDPPGAGALAPDWRSNTALIRRFRKIEGQARGLQKMVETDRDGAELLMQIASVREALRSAAAVILEEYLASHAEAMLRAESAEESDRFMEQTVELFRRWTV